MGIGDEIMASGNAKKAYAKDPTRRVMITDLNKKPRWSDMWQGLPWIAHPVRDKHATDLQFMKDGPRCRPYIDYVKGFTRQTGINFMRGWRARDHVGHIQLTENEMYFAVDTARKIGPFVIIEPLVKTAANPNKQWGRAKWQSLADLLKREGLNPIQIGPPSTIRLDGIALAVTQDFRYGAALMKFSRWNFLPDGGLHHACGALGLNATVLWGGANDPETLGYPAHENIFTPPMCGKWTPCPHCRQIWDSLTAEEVFERTKGNAKWK
jgi:hypothetical protein